MFFSEWFFNSTEEKDFGDKILPGLSKFMRELKTENYTPDKHRVKLYKIFDHLSAYLKSYDAITDSGQIQRVFIGGISKWEVVEAYHTKHMFKTWYDVVNIGLEKLIDESKSREVPAYLESYDASVTYLQNEKGAMLTRMQQDFLEVLFEWVKRQNII